MKRFKKVISILLVFALVFTSMITFNAKTTEAKVKSIKVASKKVTLIEGQSKNVKVKVKVTKKTSKKFTAKSSNKKVATVKVKKGKVVITGKKAGTAKVTVKSKANKKKKKTIKVTVKSADVTLNVTPMLRGTFIFDFSKKVSFDPSKLTVMAKKNAQGKYITNYKVYDISTNDQKSYTVILEKYPENSTWLQFTVKGINKSNIVKEVQVYEAERRRTTKYNYSYWTDEDIDRDFSLEDYLDGNFGKVKSTKGVPSGLKFTSDNEKFNLKGKITTPGVYNVFVYLEDDMGTVYTVSINFIIGSDDKITVYVPKKKGTAYEDTAGSKYFSGSSWIYIAGGSGHYTVTPTDKAGIFGDNIISYENDKYYWNFETSKIGAYTGKFTVTDNDNTSLKVESTAAVDVEVATLVTGTVTSVTGKAVPDAVVHGEFQGDRDEDYYTTAHTDKYGKYRLYVTKGTYSFYASQNDAVKLIFNKNITGNTTLNWTLGLYQVTIKSNNILVPASKFKTWYDVKDTEYPLGEGDKIFLKPGSYNLTSTGLAAGSQYSAKASVKVTGDTTVTATVTASEIPKIYEGVKNISTDGKKTYWAFTPETSGTYTIESDNSSGDPVGYLYDENGELIDEDDDGGSGTRDFYITQPLIKGETYYIAVEEYDEDPLTTNIVISKWV